MGIRIARRRFRYYPQGAGRNPRRGFRLQRTGTIFASLSTLAARGGIFPPHFRLGEHMGEVITFIPKPALDRKDRLIQEARAIYESIFPTQTPAGGQKAPKD
jgi:hypothetical protein